MFLKQVCLFILGSSAGGVIAAGIFAFLAVIGVFPRLIAYLGERKHMMLSETCMILGGVIGNVVDLFHEWFSELSIFPVPWISWMLLLIGGLASGIFVGALVMSLAETVKALPAFARRVRFAEGIQYVILAIAVGKSLGSLTYFVYQFPI